MERRAAPRTGMEHFQSIVSSMSHSDPSVRTKNMRAFTGLVMDGDYPRRTVTADHFSPLLKNMTFPNAPSTHLSEEDIAGVRSAGKKAVNALILTDKIGSKDVDLMDHMTRHLKSQKLGVRADALNVLRTWAELRGFSKKHVSKEMVSELLRNADYAYDIMAPHDDRKRITTLKARSFWLIDHLFSEGLLTEDTVAQNFGSLLAQLLDSHKRVKLMARMEKKGLFNSKYLNDDLISALERNVYSSSKKLSDESLNQLVDLAHRDRIQKKRVSEIASNAIHGMRISGERKKKRGKPKFVYSMFSIPTKRIGQKGKPLDRPFARINKSSKKILLKLHEEGLLKKEEEVSAGLI